MKNILKLIYCGLILLGSMQSYAQSANVVEGCIPLEVNFTPPAGLSAYFWDFKDGTAGSQEASPSHIFSSPGVYEVTLNEGAQGDQIGTVTITVLEDIDIIIDITLIDPCNPRRYQFTNNSIIPEGITVTGYEWIFGDGSTSNAENPIHTYAQPGPKSVSLEIFTDIAGCDNVELFENIIDVSAEPPLNAFFTANPPATCDLPAAILFTTGSVLAGVDYFWDFGDGSTSTDPTTTIHQYTENDIYEATLTLTKGDCVNTYSRMISIGAPLADFAFNDTLCIGVETELINNTSADIFAWTFEDHVTVLSSTTQRSPVVRFNQEGLTTINMVGTVASDLDCIVDTTIQVYIQDPTVEVIIDPAIACLNPMLVDITTTEEFDSYIWYGVPGGMSYTTSYIEPERDSFFINVMDTMPIDLVVTTPQGCVAELDSFFIFQNPEAHFYPNRHHGCAPLSITFTDRSTSAEPIVSYTYDYGNGDQQTFNTGDDHSYTFTDPGEYLVTLVIENDAGCIDTSWAVLIEVGEPLDISYEIDRTEICIGDTVTLSATDIDPRIDAFNLWTDEGRSHHCESGSILEHSFITNTGTFDIEYTVDYNGCRTTVIDEDAITVNGPKADLWYMINCDDPLAVMFADSSQDATRIEWRFPDGTTYDESTFTHTFAESGDYTVYLEAFNDVTGCPSQIDSVVIHARQIEAIFDLPDHLCDNVFYQLDASQSIDVDDDCDKGHTWSFTKNGRPRRVGVPVLDHIFPVAGEEIVTLEVEDINGCTSITRDTVDVFGIQPNFTFDPALICFPGEVTFLDASTADTTITNWDWLHGAFGVDNLTEFASGAEVTSEFDFFNLNLAELPIFLAVQDELGCEDTIQYNVDIYRPLTEISSDPNPICIGDSIMFTAVNITNGNDDSPLDYIWNFDNGVSSTDSMVTVGYDTPGNYLVTLNLTEESTGCQNEQTIEVLVTQPPVAAFSAFNEGDMLQQGDPICVPGTIDFQNESILNSNPVSYLWTFSNGAASLETNPTLTFPIGEVDATLVVLSDYGCADTVSLDYLVVGSEGSINADKLSICKNDSITFSLADTLGVASWQWDFGLGEVFTEVDPITQVFPDSIPGNQTIVTLSLISEGIACEVIDTVTVMYFDNVSDTIRQTINVVRGDPFELPLDVENPGLLNWVNVLEVYDSVSMSSSFVAIPPGIECLDCNEPSIDTDTEICYTYAVSYLDPDDCMEQIFIYEINPIPLEYEIPNLFSPNNDGVNEFFNIVELADSDKGTAIEEVLDFRIYNRWGKMVYNNENPAMGWDGRYDGNNAPAEVYGYYIRARLIDGSEITEKGDVTLIR